MTTHDNLIYAPIGIPMSAAPACNPKVQFTLLMKTRMGSEPLYAITIDGSVVGEFTRFDPTSSYSGKLYCSKRGYTWTWSKSESALHYLRAFFAHYAINADTIVLP